VWSYLIYIGFHLIYSLRVLTVSEQSSRKTKTLSGRKVNLNAGAELLEKYQTDWKELHEISEENAKKAEVCLFTVEFSQLIEFTPIFII
jgi:hypothetical protein